MMTKLCTLIFLTIFLITAESSGRDSSSAEREYFVTSDGKRYDDEKVELLIRGDEGCCPLLTNCCQDDYESNYEQPNDDCTLVGCLFEWFCMPFMPKD